MNEAVDPFRDWDAAYILGALNADDRRTFERHLGSCPACATAVTELAGIPGILAKIDSDTAVSLVGTPHDEYLRDSHREPDLIHKLARSASRRKRRVRRGLTAGMAAAAVVSIIVGILAGTAIRPATDLAGGPSTGNPSGNVVAMSQVQPNAMTVELRVTSKPWGTRFDWSCDYRGSTRAPGYVPQAYDLVITDASGAETTVATWSAAGTAAVGLAASSGIPIADIRTVQIRAAGTVMPLVRGQL